MSNSKFVPLVAKLAAHKNVSGYPVTPEMFRADQIFVLSPAVALEVEKLAANDKVFIHPRDLHLPYPSIFVELPLTDEVRAMRREIGRNPISRVGALINEAPGGVFSFWPVWEFVGGGLGFGQTAVLVNVPNELAELRMTMISGTPETDINLLTVPASPLLKQALEMGLSPEEFAKRFQMFKQGHPEVVSETCEEISPLLIAWATLVNCRTGVTKTHVERVKPKAAGKRSAIMHGTSYTVVTLNAIENVSADGVVSTRTDLSAHYVRGHFKQRATGLFWWQPFVRGTGEVKRRDAYFVRSTTNESVPA